MIDCINPCRKIIFKTDMKINFSLENSKIKGEFIMLIFPSKITL